MHIALLLPLCTLLASLTSSQDLQPGDRGYTAPQWYFVTRNQSALWGYQLLGSQIFPNETEVCTSIDRLTNRRWLGFAVETGYIERAFCDQAASNRSDSWEEWDVIAENIGFYTTNAFLSRLLYAFNTTKYFNDTSPTSPYPYLCLNLRPALLSAFNIQGTRLLAAICAYPNLNPPPTTNSTRPDPNSDVVTVYKQITSTLLGYLLVSASANSTEADVLCARSTVAVPSIENIGLKGRIVNEVACGRDGRRLSNDEAHVFLRRWQTEAFAFVLENASDEPDWADWLCENLDVGAMNATGLYGLGVQERFCAYGYGYVGEDGCKGDWMKK